MADKSTRPDHSSLDRLAYAQEGYFTSAQAADRGFSAQLLAHHARDGRFERVRRGLYRLRDYPTAPHEETRAAWLAMKNRAVVSHESALEVHGLSDVIADRVHLTVPREARGTRVPAGVALHTTTTPLSGADVTRRDGLLVTSSARTIVDAAVAGTAPEQIEAAIEQALRDGMTTASQLRRIAAGADRRVADLIDRSLRAEPSGE
ncbi:MAG: type IV toxin-antitoxin system AbiEi family antitoxin domain-containing protein [Thermoleophilaceae bacterium]|nr:type IV toxin-antitoxin system AbiEi family antitoxin domain-containing protein [Thermoleophilaceae bacterium]